MWLFVCVFMSHAHRMSFKLIILSKIYLLLFVSNIAGEVCATDFCSHEQTHASERCFLEFFFPTNQSRMQVIKTVDRYFHCRTFEADIRDLRIKISEGEYLKSMPLAFKRNLLSYTPISIRNAFGKQWSIRKSRKHSFCMFEHDGERKSFSCRREHRAIISCRKILQWSILVD